MNKEEIVQLWNTALHEVLGKTFEDDIIEVLALQTIDSIRRISIYETYRQKAINADEKEIPYFHTSNPFVLSQRPSLSTASKIWYIYLATYFGKSNKSGWKLFMKAAFQQDKTLIGLASILKDRASYYAYLNSFDFFNGCDYSNHRKYIKKAISGKGGVMASMDYFLDNIKEYCYTKTVEFDMVFRKSHSIPQFGRMAAFDFTSSLCKCNLSVSDPISMYHETSTGPLRALKDMLQLNDIDNPSKRQKIELGTNLLQWFMDNTDIKLVAQVLEDAICNWQKSPVKYQRYFG